jgi:formylglycine-generating enzyme
MRCVLIALGLLVAAPAFAEPPATGGIFPDSAEVGGTVRITGGNFENVTAVTFNKTPAKFTIEGNKNITATVPAGLNFGPITVTNADGSTATAQTFFPCLKNARDAAEMLYVPAGEFTMGAGKTEHKVKLNGFWMYKTPVTVALYKAFCDDTKRKMPNEPQYKWKDADPITFVTWSDAVDYAKWAGVSLPTDAQFEKASRGADARKFPWGNTWIPENCINSAKKQQYGPSAVGSCPKGASPYGLLDMAGNVWQWCSDYYSDNYFDADKTVVASNPTGPDKGNNRILRGGGWDFNDQGYFVATFRFQFTPSRAEKYTGFRCVSSAPAP